MCIKCNESEFVYGIIIDEEKMLHFDATATINIWKRWWYKVRILIFTGHALTEIGN